jgi:hypothetical protein
MRRSVVVIAVLGLMATASYTVRAGGKCSTPCGTSAQAKNGQACDANGAEASCAVTGGKLTGHFDPAMSGVCRFACATKLKYEAKNVLAQPGAQPGKLTQCPVSGVVFAVDANRPRARIGKDEYVTCCDKCATKLKHDQRHYLRV